MIVAEGWGWRHASRRDWAVRGASFTIGDGERVLLLGASGAGKSTLMHAMAGVLGGADEGEEEGRLLVDGAHPTRRHGHVGLVMQDPETQVVLARVGDDVAFGAENLGVARDEIWRRVDEALDAVGLDVGRDRPTTALSGGQKQRLTIAGALAMQAKVLLLDEPTANLDPEGAREVRDVVAHLSRERGTTLVVVEHRVELWADQVDRVIVLAPGGGILADGAPGRVFVEQREALLAAGVWVPGVDIPSTGSGNGEGSTAGPAEAPWALRGEALAIGHDPQHVVQHALDVTIPAGRSTMITGPNGAGKSTLALTLAGLLPRLDGRVVAAGELRPARVLGPRHWGRRRPVDSSDPGTWSSRDLITRIGTVFQSPEHQFVATTVRDELAVGLRALAAVDPQWTTQRIDERVDELLAMLHLSRIAGANPFTLSGGEKRRLSVGTVLATGPRVIFLDEPTFGQDRNTWLDMVALVRAMLDQGRAVVSITHDADFITALAQHRIHLEPQR
ncbi:energy-coupling factor transport system ATP-binding protein [Luteococcus japonicus]|uniref:Energy-coupling factor transport system ATP-binding protein n=1 Tax=Luteococcus japonicus TaxID=33984 RepID=A0A3N1ZV29_9ACTN|nr:ABC transporter ATP-binding protein [Luteococcus japonicus]ROR54307.1 energy-coupling factor transport system ATP-binding protein [Luteococcus japonicus]